MKFAFLTLKSTTFSWYESSNPYLAGSNCQFTRRWCKPTHIVTSWGPWVQRHQFLVDFLSCIVPSTKLDSMGCNGDRIVIRWGKDRQIWDFMVIFGWLHGTSCGIEQQNMVTKWDVIVIQWWYPGVKIDRYIPSDYFRFCMISPWKTVKLPWSDVKIPDVRL